MAVFCYIDVRAPWVQLWLGRVWTFFMVKYGHLELVSNK